MRFVSADNWSLRPFGGPLSLPTKFRFPEAETGFAENSSSNLELTGRKAKHLALLGPFGGQVATPTSEVVRQIAWHSRKVRLHQTTNRNCLGSH